MKTIARRAEIVTFLPVLGFQAILWRLKRIFCWNRWRSVEAGARASPAPGRAVRTARSWRGILAFTNLGRERRVTVSIGLRALLAALGRAAAPGRPSAWARDAAGAVGATC